MRNGYWLVISMSVSCGVAVGDPEDAGPCFEDKTCPDGYSCLVNLCIAEGSIPLQSTCSLPEQCEDFPDVTCGADPFLCRKRCSALFGAPGDCGADEYCRPERHREFYDQWIGTCFPSECQRDADCRSDRICVEMSATAGACLVECAYSFGTGEYSDTCGSSLELEQYCQPIGMAGAQKLVCLEVLGSRAALGGPCEPVHNPCEEGLACVDNICRKYCTTDPDDSCPGGFTCQAFGSSGATLYQACMPD